MSFVKCPMNKRQLAHIVRAAAAITGERIFVVVGSQAILAQFPDAPEGMLWSNEADIYPLDRPDLADDIDGAIGELSHFHEQFGYYAEGVGPETAKLPEGWEQRAYRLQNAETEGAAAICPEYTILPLPSLLPVERKTSSGYNRRLTLDLFKLICLKPAYIRRLSRLNSWCAP
jgi:hypothetical protein